MRTSTGIEREAPGSPHDHAQCVDAALYAAEAICRENGARMTATRRRVLELIWESHRPVKAYELLERMSRDGRRVKPPTIYRALDFLYENGLIHRIETLNAVVGCSDPAGAHSGYFLVCDNCETVTELASSALDDFLCDEAERLGFRVHRQSVEIFGRCRSCADSASPRGRRARQ